MKSNSLEAGIAIIKHYIDQLPHAPGVYRMLDKEDTPLYIGKAKDLTKRVQSYTRPVGLPYRIQRMISLTTHMEHTETVSEAEALLLEANLIKKLQPTYNILLKDDKSYPYIHLSKHKFPRISKHRGTLDKDGEYFGPFAAIGDVNQTITSLQKAFLLRPCSDNEFNSRKRPCLEYQIKRCSAPCMRLIEKEHYAELVKDSKNFLRGKSGAIQANLAQKMEEASATQQYEQAAIFRDRIKALTNIQTKQTISLGQDINVDIVGFAHYGEHSAIQLLFYRNGQLFGNKTHYFSDTDGLDKGAIMSSFLRQHYLTHPPPPSIYLSEKIEDQDTMELLLTNLAHYQVKFSIPKRGKALDAMKHALKQATTALKTHLEKTAFHVKHMEALAKLCDIESPIRRIETYDNSHLMGTKQLGVFVVSSREGFLKNHYRKYNMAEVNKSDDYAMMRHMLTRRFTNIKETNLPDLLIIDGGKGQLSSAQSVLTHLNIHIPVIAVAKGYERNAGNETCYFLHKSPVNLGKKDPLLYYIQNLRDEAHRFAITSYRKQHQSTLSRSLLDDIPGIGPKRKKNLLHHFGSVKTMQRASIEDLLVVEGINKKTAKTIIEFLS